MADVTMPQLGETVTEGTITKWMKKVGDKIDADEVLFEVSTDKVDSEVPSPAAGYISEILVEEGETVDVGVKLAVISSDAPGDGDGSAPAEAEADADEDTSAEAETETEEEPEAEVEAEQEPEAEAAEEEQEPEPAAEPEPEPEEPDRDAEPAKAESAPSKAGTRPSDDRPPGRPGGGGGGGKVLSPVVRRLIAEHDLDVNSIDGTGAGGRVTRADVLKMIDGGAQKPKAAPAEAKEAPAEAKEAPAPKQREEKAPARRAPAPTAKAGERDEVVPFSNIRKRTAEHMVRSLDTSAHTLVVMEVDYDGVDRVRSSVKDKFKAEEGVSLTYLPFIARAVIDAIREFPHVNASVGDNELIVHHDVNLGVAVDLNYEGLIVPVVHGADGKRLRALAREISDLANKARSKKLGMDEIAGGTFTITNAGGYGTFMVAPIINQPQVAILSTDGVKMRPVAVKIDDGEYGIAVHPVGNLALAFDHRAYDGAYASAFMAKVKDILETRDWSQEL